MSPWLIACALLVSPLLPSAGLATTTLNVTGVVTGMTHRYPEPIGDYGLGAASSAVGDGIGVGDIYSVTATFDTATAKIASGADDPTFTSYYLPATTVALRIGSYERTFTTSWDPASIILLENDRPYLFEIDSQRFSFFDSDPQGANLPFNLGDQAGSFSASFWAQDTNATARDSDLISEIRPLDLFGTKFLFLDQMNTVTGEAMQVRADVTSASITTVDSAVPEPAAWFSMILGFGLVGAAMRSRSHGACAAG